MICDLTMRFDLGFAHHCLLHERPSTKQHKSDRNWSSARWGLTDTWCLAYNKRILQIWPSVACHWSDWTRHQESVISI